LSSESAVGIAQHITIPIAVVDAAVVVDVIVEGIALPREVVDAAEVIRVTGIRIRTASSIAIVIRIHVWCCWRLT
jgi:hypothetical protein